MNKIKSLLLIGFPILSFLLLYFVIGFDGLYGQDGYEYLRYAEALRGFFITGNHPGDYFWPLYYPIFGALGSFITQNTAVSLLLISVISYLLSSYYLLKCIYLLFPEKQKESHLNFGYIFTFFMLSPYVFKHGMLVMSDMLTTLFVVLTLYHFLKYTTTGILKYFYYIAIFSVAAVMTRYASAIIVLPFIVASTFYFIKQKKHFFHYVLLTGIVLVLLTPHILIRFNHTAAFLSHPWLQEWSVFNFFETNFSNRDGTHQYSWYNIIYAFSNIFHPRFLLIGIIFLPFLFLKKFTFKNRNVISISVVLYALFLAGIPFQNNRFLLLSFPLIIILLYPIFLFFSELYIIKKFMKLGFIILIGIQAFLIVKTMESNVKRNTFEIEMAEVLKPFQNKTLYSFDVDIAMQGRKLNFEYKNMWEKRYLTIEVGDLVLFHPTKFTQQWKEKNPILNWDYFNKHYHLKIIKNCPEGWKLYKIEQK